MAVSRIDEAGLNVNQYGNRNLVINGAMQVSQRATSEASLQNFDKFPCVDRYKIQGNSSGTFTISQSTTSPDGFGNSLKIDCTTADSSPNYLIIMQRMEGQNLQQLKKGTSSAEKVTVSFYVRSSKTGTYQFNLRDNGNSRLLGKTYTIDTADTWERKILTFDGDTSGTLANDNTDQLRLEWWLAAGSTYNSGSVPTAWEALANGDRAAGLNVAIGASTSDDFYLTGVQLEVGDTATDFEHRTFADELQKCQRYTFVHETGVAYGWSALSGYCNTTSNALAFYQFPVKMRAAPSLTVSGDFQILDGFTSYSVTNNSLGMGTVFNARVDVSASGLTAGRHIATRNNNDADAKVIFDAEL